MTPTCDYCGANTFERTCIEGVVEHEFIVNGVYRREVEPNSTTTVDEWVCSNCGDVVAHDTYVEIDLNAVVEAAEKAASISS